MDRAYSNKKPTAPGTRTGECFECDQVKNKLWMSEAVNVQVLNNLESHNLTPTEALNMAQNRQL